MHACIAVSKRTVESFRGFHRIRSKGLKRGKNKSMSRLPLLFRSIKDRRRGIHDFEIGGHGEQGRIRIASHDIRQAERLFPHARVAPFAVDHRLEIGRSPHLGHNRNRLLISDLTGWYRVRRSCALHQDAFHGLRTKVLGIRLALPLRNQVFLEEYIRPLSRYGRRHCIGWRQWRRPVSIGDSHRKHPARSRAARHGYAPRTHGKGSKLGHFLRRLLRQIQCV